MFPAPSDIPFISLKHIALPEKITAVALLEKKKRPGPMKAKTFRPCLKKKISLRNLKETRNLLKLTRDRYQNFFEHSSVPIFIINPETGFYLDANVAASDLTGFNKTALLEMNVFDLRPPNEHHRAAQELKSILADDVIPNPENDLNKEGWRKDASFTNRAKSSLMAGNGSFKPL